VNCSPATGRDVPALQLVDLSQQSVLPFAEDISINQDTDILQVSVDRTRIYLLKDRRELMLVKAQHGALWKSALTPPKAPLNFHSLWVTPNDSTIIMFFFPQTNHQAEFQLYDALTGKFIRAFNYPYSLTDFAMSDDGSLLYAIVVGPEFNFPAPPNDTVVSIDMNTGQIISRFTFPEVSFVRID
jgi:hypothetical protein